MGFIMFAGEQAHGFGEGEVMRRRVEGRYEKAWAWAGEGGGGG
jgi:hypothetical protein